MYDMRAFFRGGKAHSPRRSFICTKSCEQATNTSTSCLKHPFPIKVIGTRSHATHQYQVPARALSLRWLPHLAVLLSWPNRRATLWQYACQSAAKSILSGRILRAAPWIARRGRFTSGSAARTSPPSALMSSCSARSRFPTVSTPSPPPRRRRARSRREHDRKRGPAFHRETG